MYSNKVVQTKGISGTLTSERVSKQREEKTQQHSAKKKETI